MNLQPEDFWSYYQWLVRPNAFLESALLQGIVLIVLSIVLGLLVGYIISAARYGPVEGFYAVARMVRDLVRFDLPGHIGSPHRRSCTIGVQGGDSPQGVVCGRSVCCRPLDVSRLVSEP